MKTIQCQDCEGVFRAETREEILGQLYDHYMKAHHEIITNVTDEEKKAWMARFEKEWATAVEE